MPLPRSWITLLCILTAARGAAFGQPSAEVAAPPRAKVIEAWSDSNQGLKSGRGQGRFRIVSVDVKTGRETLREEWAVSIAFNSSRYRIEMRHVSADGRPENDVAQIAVCDGYYSACRRIDPNVMPHGETVDVCRLSDFPPTAFVGFPFDPTHLNWNVPRTLKMEPGWKFRTARDGTITAAMDKDLRTVTILYRLTFRSSDGHNLSRFSVNRDTLEGAGQDLEFRWSRTAGVWYVTAVQEGFLGTADRAKRLDRFTYTEFEPNARVEPGQFRLASLGIKQNARVIHQRIDGTPNLVYEYRPLAERFDSMDNILEAMRTLPRR
jgi:hypothetical protein